VIFSIIFPRRLSSVFSKFSHKKLILGRVSLPPPGGCHPGRSALDPLETPLPINYAPRTPSASPSYAYALHNAVACTAAGPGRADARERSQSCIVGELRTPLWAKALLPLPSSDQLLVADYWPVETRYNLTIKASGGLCMSWVIRLNQNYSIYSTSYVDIGLAMQKGCRRCGYAHATVPSTFSPNFETLKVQILVFLGFEKP